MKQSAISAFQNSTPANPVLPLDLFVTETFGDGEVVRTMRLGETEIFFRTRSEHLPPPLKTWDFAVIASIFTAMRLRRPLHVHGPVSHSLLANLEEFQEAWATWMPRQYGIVEIICDSEPEPEIVHPGKAVFAFSGGVDATFSLVRHTAGKAGRRTLVPEVAVLVHGFDIGLDEPQAIATATASARATLETLGVPMAIIETNWKTDLCYDWRMEHATGLIACLAQFAGLADTAVIGGDEGYDNVDIPWGSNPVSNPLLSSDSLAVRTEGSGLTRSERVGFLVEQNAPLENLRVCWENAHSGSNCGTCEKCIRSQLNFRANGAEPQGFVRLAEWWRIATIPSRSAGDNYFLREALAVAKRRGVKGAWRYAVQLGILKNTLFWPKTYAMRALKTAIRRNEPLYRTLRKALGK
jgi:hypothetical protein